jgi:hypothetical protein
MEGGGVLGIIGELTKDMDVPGVSKIFFRKSFSCAVDHNLQFL